MASTGLNFNNLTPPALTVDSLRELLFLRVLGADAVGELVTVMPDQRHGKHIGLVGEFGLLGRKSEKCSPTYDAHLVAAQEKVWDIQEWQISEQLCYADLEGTLAHEALKSQTDIADLTGDDYLRLVVLPRLELAMRKLALRLIWFGDKDAAAAAEGGIIADADYVENFSVIDGLWKRLQALAAANPDLLTPIDANDKGTWAEQKAAAWAEGYATDLMDGLITDAPLVLRDQSDGVIYITLALKDALDHDIKRTNKGSELQWQSVFGGIQRTDYNGVSVVAVPFWDEIIRNYEVKGEDGSFNKPYRAVYTVKDNLLVGTESSARSGISYFNTFFVEKDQLNYILAKDKLGTELLQDDLAQVAY